MKTATMTGSDRTASPYQFYKTVRLQFGTVRYHVVQFGAIHESRCTVALQLMALRPPFYGTVHCDKKIVGENWGKLGRSLGTQAG